MYVYIYIKQLSVLRFTAWICSQISNCMQPPRSPQQTLSPLLSILHPRTHFIHLFLIPGSKNQSAAWGSLMHLCSSSHHENVGRERIENTAKRAITTAPAYATGVFWSCDQRPALWPGWEETKPFNPSTNLLDKSFWFRVFSHVSENNN